MGQQLSLVEALMDPRLGANAKLARIDALIDWTRVAPHAARIRGSEAGRPPYPPLAMLKSLYLPSSPPFGCHTSPTSLIPPLDHSFRSGIHFG